MEGGVQGAKYGMELLNKSEESELVRPNLIANPGDKFIQNLNGCFWFP